MKVKDYHHMKDFKEFKCSQFWKIQPKKKDPYGFCSDWLQESKQRRSWKVEELTIFIWGVDDFSSEELTIFLIGWGPRTFMGWNLIGSTFQGQFQCKIWLAGVLGPLWGEIWLAERPTWPDGHVGLSANQISPHSGPILSQIQEFWGVFWKQKPSLINLILNTKSEKHVCNWIHQVNHLRRKLGICSLKLQCYMEQ